MNKRQQRRAEVVGRLSAGAITKDEAGSLLELSRRQVNQILKDYDANGIASIVHGNSGRTPSNQTNESLAASILPLVRKNETDTFYDDRRENPSNCSILCIRLHIINH